jgi:hypothetical protein
MDKDIIDAQLARVRVADGGIVLMLPREVSAIKPSGSRQMLRKHTRGRLWRNSKDRGKETID